LEKTNISIYLRKCAGLFIEFPESVGFESLATFAGTQSYGPSSAGTAFGVTAAAATPAPTEPPAESVADMYFVPATAGLFVLIIIVAIVLALLMLRKK
jgi:hypothetical protein